MVVRVVQRGEVHPVGLDLGTIRHVEADGAEDLLHAFPSAHDRMQAAARHGAAGQRHVDGLGGQARVHQRIGQRLAARLQGTFHLLLDLVDARAFGLARLGVELAQALEQLGQRPGLAQEAGLFVFQRGVVVGGGEGGLCIGDDLIQIQGHDGNRGKG
ncbi:hypothetical protein D3C72_1232420 [compost metagenome]